MGGFPQNYGGDVGTNPKGNAIQPDGSKKPWQRKNTRKLDAIRNEIEKLQLDDVTKSVALTSLILAMDKVESTLGHFSSYLKDWSPRSFNDMCLKVPMLWQNTHDHNITRRDVFDILPRCELRPCLL